MIHKISFSGNTSNEFSTLKIAEEKCQKLGKVYSMSNLDKNFKFRKFPLDAQNAILAKNDEKLSAQLELIAEQNKAIIEYNKRILNGINVLFDASFRLY